jgi:hypothetical protein
MRTTKTNNSMIHVRPRDYSRMMNNADDILFRQCLGSMIDSLRKFVYPCNEFFIPNCNQGYRRERLAACG